MNHISMKANGYDTRSVYTVSSDGGLFKILFEIFWFEYPYQTVGMVGLVSEVSDPKFSGFELGGRSWQHGTVYAVDDLRKLWRLLRETEGWSKGEVTNDG